LILGLFGLSVYSLISANAARKKLRGSTKSTNDQLSFIHSLVDSIPNPLFVKDTEGCFVTFNREYEEAFGIKRDDYIGKTVLDMEYIPGDDRELFHSEDMRLLKESGAKFYDLQIPYTDGEIHDVLYWVRSFDLANGERGGLLGVLVDITERKRLEAALAKANKRMEDELNFGRDIQMSMLPKEFPDFPGHDGFDLHGLLVPARELGGDFFDCFALDENRLYFCVGDVSGKGVPAALFMAMTKNMLSVMAQEVQSTAEIVTLTNDKISSDNAASMFVTLFVGIYNLQTQELYYTNAGHNPPLLRRKNGDIELLKQIHGPVVGAVDGIEYKEDEDQISTGDTLLAFTDGVTEAMNRDGGFYGDDRLFEFFSASNFETAESLTNDVLSSVEKFAVDTEQADDITILALRPD
jgi:PAS domain S-box-containing protein